MIKRRSLITAAAILLIPSAAWSTNVIDWDLKIKASTSTHAENRLSIGQRLNATDGFDGRYEVPAYVEGNISAYLPHIEWGQEAVKYWRDIMGPEQGKNWTIMVESTLAGDTTTLSWKSKKLAGFSATLTDNATNETIDMTSVGSYSYTNNGPREFTINAVAPLDLPKTRPVKSVARFLKFTSGSPAEFTLGAATDSEGYAISYNVEVYRDRQMNNLVASVNDLSSEEGDVTWSAGLLSDGVYFYRIDVYNGLDYSGWSSTRAFRVGSGAADERTDKAYGGKRF